MERPFLRQALGPCIDHVAGMNAFAAAAAVVPPQQADKYGTVFQQVANAVE